MRVWFDLSHPKDVLFFKGIIAEMQRRGHEIVLTHRNYVGVEALAEYFGLKSEPIGNYGETKKEKLLFGIQRMRKLYERLKDEKIDVAVNFCNPEASRVAFGFGIPLFLFTDLPESEKVMRLTLPLAEKVFVPFHVERSLIEGYGAKSVYVYPCLDCCAWMKDYLMPEKLYPSSRPIIAYRDAETKTSYYENLKDLTLDIVRVLKHKISNAYFEGFSRYKRQFDEYVQGKLLWADLFIGGGGTMNTEACYWGTPTISTRPFTTSYDRWLEAQGLQVHVKSVEEGVERSLELLKMGKNPNSQRIRDMRFPLGEICDIIEKRG